MRTLIFTTTCNQNRCEKIEKEAWSLNKHVLQYRAGDIRNHGYPTIVSILGEIKEQAMSPKGWHNQILSNSCLPCLASVLICNSTIYATPQERPGEPLSTLSEELLLRFERGKIAFEEDLGVKNGLGPIFNQTEACLTQLNFKSKLLKLQTKELQQNMKVEQGELHSRLFNQIYFC